MHHESSAAVPHKHTHFLKTATAGGRGAPSSPSAFCSITQTGECSVVQNGLSSASLNRLLTRLRYQAHRGQVPWCMHAMQCLQCAPAHCPQDERPLAFRVKDASGFIKLHRARLQDLRRPSGTLGGAAWSRAAPSFGLCGTCLCRELIQPSRRRPGCLAALHLRTVARTAEARQRSDGSAAVAQGAQASTSNLFHALTFQANTLFLLPLARPARKSSQDSQQSA